MGLPQSAEIDERGWDMREEIAADVKQTGEGDGTLLQYSCLETPMDGGAW